MEMEDYEFQVGGHSNKIKINSNNGSTIIKLTNKKEFNFYNNNKDDFLNFNNIFTPIFYGSLKLEGKLNEKGELQTVNQLNLDSDEIEEEMLVLENLTHRFLRPNVLDVKLGTQLFDDDASEEKKIKMETVAKETTSFETGLRLTGFQVWDSLTSKFIKTNKTYGKSLWTQHLLEALSKFFLLPLGRVPKTEFSDQTNTKDLYIKCSTPIPISPSNSPIPLPVDLLRSVLLGILSQLYQLRGVLENVEFRMRGGSLLVVFEGDEDALRKALEREKEERRLELEEDELEKANRASVVEGENKDDSEDMEEEEEDDDPMEEDDESSSETDSILTSDSNGLALPHTLLSLDIRLIDFAHTTLTPGEGPDEGVLKGIDTFIELVEGLVRELELDNESTKGDDVTKNRDQVEMNE